MSLPTVARRFRRPALILGFAALAAAVALSPGALSLSNGATNELVPDPAFQDFGCAACHGPHNEFLPLNATNLEFIVLDQESGAPLNGPYTPDADYQITITLHEQNAPDGGRTGQHAGFNLRVSAGTLAGVDGNSQVNGDGSQATHVDATSTNWTVMWTAPHEGPVAFRLFVNDANGDGAPDEGDQVYQRGFWITDPTGAEVGAAVEEAHAEFGVTLQQYWIGLIGLAGMLFIMVAGYVYLKYVNPNNTDPKDR